MKVDIFHGIPTRRKNHEISQCVKATVQSVEGSIQVLAREYYTRGFGSGFREGLAYSHLFGPIVATLSTEPAAAYWDVVSLFQGLLEDNGITLFDHLKFKEKFSSE